MILYVFVGQKNVRLQNSFAHRETLFKYVFNDRQKTPTESSARICLVKFFITSFSHAITRDIAWVLIPISLYISVTSLMHLHFFWYSRWTRFLNHVIYDLDQRNTTFDFVMENRSGLLFSPLVLWWDTS